VWNFVQWYFLIGVGVKGEEEEMKGIPNYEQIREKSNCKLLCPTSVL
jgi:hypothetical protein